MPGKMHKARFESSLQAASRLNCSPKTAADTRRVQVRAVKICNQNAS